MSQCAFGSKSSLGLSPQVRTTTLSSLVRADGNDRVRYVRDAEQHLLDPRFDLGDRFLQLLDPIRQLAERLALRLEFGRPLRQLGHVGIRRVALLGHRLRLRDGLAALARHLLDALERRSRLGTAFGKSGLHFFETFDDVAEFEHDPVLARPSM